MGLALTAMWSNALLKCMREMLRIIVIITQTVTQCCLGFWHFKFPVLIIISVRGVIDMKRIERINQSKFKFLIN